MYAVIEFNKNQYVVKKDEQIIIDKLETEDKKLKFDNILFYKDEKTTLIGKPYVKNVIVEAEVVKDFKDKKVIVFKFKRKKNYKKKMGHRQPYTVLKISDIKVS